MIPAAEALHRAIEQVCPIVSVSIGRRSDRGSWRIDFADNATGAERAAAQAVLDGFQLSFDDTGEDALLERLRAACPGAGVIIGAKDDRTTWELRLPRNARKARREAAERVLEQFEFPLAEVPAALSRRQFFMQMENAGLTDRFAAWRKVQPVRIHEIAIAESGAFGRYAPEVTDAFAALGLDAAGIDGFFAAAAKL